MEEEIISYWDIHIPIFTEVQGMCPFEQHLLIQCWGTGLAFT